MLPRGELSEKGINFSGELVYILKWMYSTDAKLLRWPKVGFQKLYVFLLKGTKLQRSCSKGHRGRPVFLHLLNRTYHIHVMIIDIISEYSTHKVSTNCYKASI